MRRVWIAALLLLPLLAGAASAQTSNEDRLREAVKRLTADLRTTQDGQAGLRAQVEELTHQRDDLLQQVSAAKAPVAKPPVDDGELQRLRAAVAAARGGNAELQAALAKWQSAYKDAAALAQARDADAKRLDATARGTGQTLEACKQANTKLIATALDILHLYQTQGFRSLLLKSYEPLLGLKRVELENMVQDYEDKIGDAKFSGRTASSPATANITP